MKITPEESIEELFDRYRKSAPLLDLLFVIDINDGIERGNPGWPAYVEMVRLAEELSGKHPGSLASQTARVWRAIRKYRDVFPWEACGHDGTRWDDTEWPMPEFELQPEHLGTIVETWFYFYERQEAAKSGQKDEDAWAAPQPSRKSNRSTTTRSVLRSRRG